jgi:mono/diheme cytochrome c family protein
MKNPKQTILAVFGMASVALHLTGCKANQPSRVETKIAQESKEVVVGGKNWPNPVPNDESSIKSGGERFRHDCQVCHGLDGHATGVTFARNMSPPVPDLGAPAIQKYTDGQMKWIIENGIRLTGMPGWKGLIQDEEIWQMVRYVRHLPRRGSLGVPEVFIREGEANSKEHRKQRHK